MERKYRVNIRYKKLFLHYRGNSYAFNNAVEAVEHLWDKDMGLNDCTYSIIDNGPEDYLFFEEFRLMVKDELQKADEKLMQN